MAAACNAPVTCMETAGEGGPYGMALLAAYADNRDVSLEAFLENRVFAACKSSTLSPVPEDVAGVRAYLKNFADCLPVEKQAEKSY